MASIAQRSARCAATIGVLLALLGLRLDALAKPKDGKVVTRNTNGAPQYETTWVNGVREGPYRSFHANGSVFQQGNYHEGLKEGVWEEYLSDGRLLWTNPYYRGKLQGERKQWWDACDDRTGRRRDWTLFNEYFMGKRHGRYIQRQCNSNRVMVRVVEGTFDSDKREGDWNSYVADTGALRSTDRYHCGEKLDASQPARARGRVLCEAERRKWMKEVAAQITTGVGGFRTEGCPALNTDGPPRKCDTFVIRRPATWSESARRALAAVLSSYGCVERGETFVCSVTLPLSGKPRSTQSARRSVRRAEERCRGKACPDRFRNTKCVKGQDCVIGGGKKD